MNKVTDLAIKTTGVFFYWITAIKRSVVSMSDRLTDLAEEI